ncbi:MAG: acetamidase/formamidase family protein [Lachnospiraceae bacterium]|nr:acetamidase/formamidase family protein [Lachnospiraceae bacterium]
MKEIKDQYIYNMSPSNTPALTVGAGETVVFHGRDCFNNQITSEDTGIDSLDWSTINPATGPLYVDGAEPGDILKVTIQSIELGDYGTMAAIPKDGVLGKDIQTSKIRRLPVKNRIATFAGKYEIPCTPMIGVIGVAPAEGEIPTGEPGTHGGNMDNTKIGEGTSLYFPVAVKGALLAMGDVHANMGDGEIMVTGIEIPARITVQVDVIKGESIPTPYLETAEKVYVIASDADLEKAIYAATSEMCSYVQSRTGLDLNDAGMLMSAVGDLEICQVVDPKRTVRFCMEKKYLKKII